MRAVLALLFTLAATPAAAGELSWAVYGNWCGPGHGSGPAIDGLDAACRRHDLCVRRTGIRYNCDCDLAFMDELRRRSWPSEEMYQHARAIYEGIALVPCRDPDGQATKLDWMMNDRLGALASGREPPFSSLGRFLKLLGESEVREK